MELKAPPKRPEVCCSKSAAWVLCRDNSLNPGHVVLISRVHEVSPLDEIYPDLEQTFIACEQELIAQEALLNPTSVNLGHTPKNTHRKSTKIFGKWS